MRRAWVTAAVATVVAGALVTPPARAAAPGHYVALGDSYTSAPLVPPAAPNSPAQCGQSAANYPHVLAATLGLALTDVSCGGATVGNFRKAQWSDQAPQFSALTADATLVTIGIGGNDNNLFASVVTGCGATALLFTLSLTPCRDRFGDEFAQKIAADEVNLRAAVREVRHRAPKARVVLVGYPNIMPTDALGQAGCLIAGVPFTPGDLDYVDGIERALNAMLARAAAAQRVLFVDTYTPSVGHDMCRLPGTRWIEPLIPLSPAAQFHPNAAGEAATAADLQRALG
ncbi:MAG TPA: SGNH/GDSL hydrolase family protein [Sporichthyaceae bacterium]|jgi:lysophospholipase L1-like esterase